MILVWDRKRAIIARYSVEDHLIGWLVGRLMSIRLILSLGDIRSDVRESLRGRSDEAISRGLSASSVQSEGKPDARWSEKAPLASHLWGWITQLQAQYSISQLSQIFLKGLLLRTHVSSSKCVHSYSHRFNSFAQTGRPDIVRWGYRPNPAFIDGDISASQLCYRVDQLQAELRLSKKELGVLALSEKELKFEIDEHKKTILGLNGKRICVFRDWWLRRGVIIMVHAENGIFIVFNNFSVFQWLNDVVITCHVAVSFFIMCYSFFLSLCVVK